MGLSAAISGGIMIFTMIYVMMSFPTLLDDTAKVSRSSSDMSNTLNDIMHTNINISNLQDKSGEPSIVTFSIINSGNTILWDYNKFDVIVTYPPTSIGNQVTSVLQYSNNCSALLTDQWCISNISNDLIHPGILDPGETANIQAQLSSTVKGGIITMNFVTDNGIVTSSSVTIS
ncbi:MAG: hypothetical protein ABI342_01215 [Nitrososphaera sp.]|jgi:flagellar protein FlaF